MKKTRAITSIVLILAVTTASANPILTSAKVTQVQNDVRLKEGAATPGSGGELDPAPSRGLAASEHNAKVGDVVQGTRTLSTGKKSRAELLFNDNTVARLGANSVFSFKPGSRDIDLKSGFLLLHTPKGQGGAKITTPSAAASVLGTTVMLAALPGGGMKLVVLEGTASIKYNGITQNVGAGQLVFLTQENGMSPPINVDLKQLVASSGLFNNFKGTIGSEQLIQEAIKEQAEKIEDGELEASGFKIGGDQNGLNILNAAVIEALLQQFVTVQNALSHTTAEIQEDMSDAFSLSPPASIDFSTPLAVSDTGLSLLGVPGESGSVMFFSDRFYFTNGPPANLSNLQGGSTAIFSAAGEAVDYLTRFNAIRFDGFQSSGGEDAGGFNNLNLVFSADRGSIGVFNSNFEQNGDLFFHAGGWKVGDKGNVDIFNSRIQSAGTGGAGVFINTATGNILINQSEILLASSTPGTQILLDAPGTGAAIVAQNSIINSAVGANPGAITIPANQLTGRVDLTNTQIIAANSQLASDVRVLASMINLANTTITGSMVILGNNAQNATINFIGDQNFIYTSAGVDGLVINGTQTGTVNVGTIGQQGTTPVGP